MTVPRASTCGCPVDSLPGWRRPVLVVSHPAERCRPLDELLTAFRDSGAEPAVLCLSDGTGPTGEARTPVTAGCLPADPHGSDVPYRHVHLGQDHRRPTAVPAADHGGLRSTVEDAVRRHAADGIVAVSLGRTPDHPLHHRTARAALHAAAGLGLHALINPCRPGGGSRYRHPR
jgi:hypothetical protein